MIDHGKVPVPTHFIQKGISMGLSFEDIAVACALTGFAENKEFTFNQFFTEAAYQGPTEEDKLTPFQIREIIKRLERENFLRVIKYKEHYRVEWLAKSFGES